MRRFMLGALIAALALSVMSGCAAKPVPETQPTVPVDSASTPTASVEVASGESSAPAAAAPMGPPAVVKVSHGTSEPQGAERKKLMDAARKLLGTKSQFGVLLLKSNGAWAVGRLDPVKSGPTVWVAWRNQSNGGWKAIWSSKATKLDSAAIRRADSRFPKAMAKIRMVKVPNMETIREEVLSEHSGWSEYDKDYASKMSKAVNAELGKLGLVGRGGVKGDETAPKPTQSPRAGTSVPEGTTVIWSSTFG